MSQPARRCPICEGPVGDLAQPEVRRLHPFCSERCKLVDLDHWLSGEYRIPGTTVHRPVEPEA